VWGFLLMEIFADGEKPADKHTYIRIQLLWSGLKAESDLVLEP
jgi:hypothetical protein